LILEVFMVVHNWYTVLSCWKIKTCQHFTLHTVSFFWIYIMEIFVTVTWQIVQSPISAKCWRCIFSLRNEIWFGKLFWRWIMICRLAYLCNIPDTIDNLKVHL
jgi:hypothetical protein